MQATNLESVGQTLLLGVDAGGTRCRARVADLNGQILGEGVGSAANVLTDPEGSWRSIKRSAETAFEAAGLTPPAPESLVSVLGLAGLDPTRPEAPTDWPLSSLGAAFVDTDAYIAQRGAFAGGDGAILIVGTGAVGLLVDGGQRVSIGGYGAAIGDEGSGAWIGREAVRRALWAFDGRSPPSELTRQILDEVGKPPLAQAWANDAAPGDYAALAPMVFAAAERGDQTADDILNDAATHLDQVLVRLARAGAREACLMGGIGARLKSRLRTKTLAMVEPQGTALDGAMRLARALALSRIAPSTPPLRRH